MHTSKGLVAGTLLLLISMLAIPSFGKSFNDNIPIDKYEKIKWGMSKESILRLYKNKHFELENGDNNTYAFSLNIYDTREDCDVYMIFQFNDNALDSVVIYYRPSSEAFITVANFDSYAEVLTKKFGTPLHYDNSKTVDVIDGKREKRHLWSSDNIYISLTIKQEDGILALVENYTTQRRVVQIMEKQKRK
jgi:hypothetical protein